MSQQPLYPLRFEPIFKSALWGGQRLAEWFGPDVAGGDQVAEAWVLSDQGENLSRVAEGPLRGRTLRELLDQTPERILGRSALTPARRFPLLLKFIDARQVLSVQVHPHDRHAHLIPEGDQGKTEAWVILAADADSAIYAGWRAGAQPEQIQQAIREHRLGEQLHHFVPKPGDCVFIPAGMVHAIGAGIVLFEIQQTSNVTFRLHDWDRVDPGTGQTRALHLEEALECLDFTSGPGAPVQPVLEVTEPARRELLVACPYFQLWRWQGKRPFTVGAAGACRVLVGITGQATVEHEGRDYRLRPGDVLLLPAEVSSCACRPDGPVTLLECGLPE
ncbi:MAG: type I phosphomannose isomerase catalytic subunit [Gemmataceae bacterium]